MRRQGCGQSADSRCKGRCVLMNRFRFLPSYHFADSTDGIIQNPAALTLRDYTITGSEGGVGDCAEKRSDIPSGYEQLAYIESTGTQYIDTGIKVEDVYGFDIKYQSTGKVPNKAAASMASTLNAIMGVNAVADAESKSFDTKIWFTYTDTKQSISAMMFGGTSFSIPYATLEEYYNTIHHITFETDGTVLYNGNAKGLAARRTDPENMSRKGVTLYLFDVHNLWGTYRFYSKTRMYHVKFYDESQALLGDFVPCKRIADGVLGMYDAVNGTFFTNQGTGTFLSAPLTYTIPILNNGTKVAEIVRSAPLYAGESISYRGDGLPAVPLSSGSNALTIGTAVQPSSVTYRYDTY